MIDAVTAADLARVLELVRRLDPALVVLVLVAAWKIARRLRFDWTLIYGITRQIAQTPAAVALGLPALILDTATLPLAILLGLRLRPAAPPSAVRSALAALAKAIEEVRPDDDRLVRLEARLLALEHGLGVAPTARVTVREVKPDPKAILGPNVRPGPVV